MTDAYRRARAAAVSLHTISEMEIPAFNVRRTMHLVFDLGLQNAPDDETREAFVAMLEHGVDLVQKMTEKVIDGERT